MKKTWPHTVHHSGKKCAGCGCRLKANLVERKGYNSILRCYSCHVAAEAKRGHLMRNGYVQTPCILAGHQEKPC